MSTIYMLQGLKDPRFIVAPVDAEDDANAYFQVPYQVWSVPASQAPVPAPANVSQWQLQPTGDGFFTIFSVAHSSKALCAPEDLGITQQCYTQPPAGRLCSQWSSASFPKDPIVGVPFQLVNRAHQGVVACGPDDPDATGGNRVYMQAGNNRVNAWWVLVDAAPFYP